MPTYVREDQASISVTINGTKYGDSWKEVEGGNLEADDAKTRPGGMGKEVAVGGPASRDDLTVRTQMSDITALWNGTLEPLVGNARVSVGISWLGPDRSPLGSGTTRQGILKAVNLPDMGDGADVGLYEIVVSCDEVAA